MVFETHNVPSGLENWLEAITEHLCDLKHLNLELEFDQSVDENNLERLQVSLPNNLVLAQNLSIGQTLLRFQQ